MTTTDQSSIGSEVGRRLLKAAIAIAGLIVIRLILDNLPMLTHAQPIYIGGGGGQEAAVSAWSSVVQQMFNSGQLARSMQDIGRGVGLPFILPVWIANAVVDTLIFAVLIATAAGFSPLVRARSKRVPEGGVMILLLVLTIVAALAYRSYMLVVLPLLGSQANLYGWFFLALGLLPLMGFIIVGARNLDGITELALAAAKQARAAGPQPAMAGGSTPRAAASSPASASPEASPTAAVAAAVCPQCGGALAAGAKFCGVCGSAAPAARSAEPVCPGCGAKQEPGAKFCERCGQALQKTGAAL